MSSIIRSSLLRICLCLLILTSLHAQLIDVPFGGVLSVNTENKVEYDSNLFANSFELGDWSAGSKAMLHYLKEDGRLKVDALGGFEGRHYFHRDQFDYQDLDSSLTTSWPNGVEDPNLTLDTMTSYKETTSASDALGRRTLSNDFTTSLNAGYHLNSQLSYKLKPEFKYQDARDTGTFDIKTYTLSNEVNLTYSSTLSAALVHRYRNLNAEGLTNSISSDDNAIYLSLVGELLPKVIGLFDIGYQQRNFRDSPIETRYDPYVLLGANWAPIEKIAFNILIMQDFESSSGNTSSVARRFSTDMIYTLTPKIEASFGYGYETTQFSGFEANSARRDIKNEFRVGLKHIFTENSFAYLQTKFVNKNSELAPSTYDQYVFTLGFNINFL